MKKISEITNIIIATIVGFPLVIILFLLTSGLVLTLLDGRSHFINDTSEKVNVLIFTYNNYERNYGEILGPYSINPSEKKSVWTAYPYCIYLPDSKKSFVLPYMAPKPNQKEPAFLLSKIISNNECPLDLKDWKPETKWSCKHFGKSIEPCKQL